MATTPVNEIGQDCIRREEKEALVSHILESSTFQNSRKSQQLLQYIVQNTLDESLQDCSEQQIGIRIFGRSPGFNASEDSIVRSQARLLRQRLESYFSHEGKSETLVVKIPRGHYIAVFRRNTADPSAPSTDDDRASKPASLPDFSEPALPLRFSRYVWAALTLGVVLGAVIGSGWNRRAARESVPAPALWAHFLASGSQPLVIYSNAIFVGNGTDGLRYATATEAASGLVMDHYTGIGEVASVHTLTRFFDEHQQSFILKRSRLVTWDDARSRSLIFVGAPGENPSLRVLPDSQDFQFVRDGSVFDIRNLRPLAGEPTLMKHSEWPMTVDYAIVSLRPGLEPGTKILIFSGMTTIGTQAAVEFACTPTGAEALLPAAEAKKDTYFDAVLMVSVNSGVPVSSRIIAMHRTQ
jgi:hypothetical protein